MKLHLFRFSVVCLCAHVSKSRLWLVLLCVFSSPAWSGQLGQHVTLDLKGYLHVIDTRENPRYLRPWFEGGTGVLAHHENDDAWLGGQFASLHLDTDSPVSFQLNAQWHREPEAGYGITEAWLSWNPLPKNGYRLSARAGWFYPGLSLENSDTAWTSPYTRNFSAINSWFAEELRSRGLEISVKRLGRAFSSQHDLEAVFGLFQGNDALGTLLAWRGFAIHDLQTSLGERIDFANYPSIRAGLLAPQPPWVEPTRELDGHTGYYTGFHASDQRSYEVRAYFYDNRADPTVFRHGQYAWHTRFRSVAAQYAVGNDGLLLAQWLSGRSEMGARAVDIDFDAWFILFNWQHERHSWSARYDVYDVADNDFNAFDNNDGNGDSITLAWQYAINDHVQVGLEYVRLKSRQADRLQWRNWWASAEEENTMLTFIWRW